MAKEPSEMRRASRAWYATSWPQVMSFAIVEFEIAIKSVRHIPCNNLYRLHIEDPGFQELLAPTLQGYPQAWYLGQDVLVIALSTRVEVCCGVDNGDEKGGQGDQQQLAQNPRIVLRQQHQTSSKAT